MSARAIGSCLALLCTLPVLGGCMTSALYQGIREAPRLKTGDYPALEKARFHGELAGTGVSFRAYLAHDPLWSGKNVSRRMTLLVPTDRGKPALLVTRSVDPGGMPEDQNRIAACTKDALLAGAVVRTGIPPLPAPNPLDDVLVVVSKPAADGEASVRAGALRQAGAANLAAVLLILYDESYRYRTLHTASRGSPGSADSGWEWSQPVPIVDCLPKPTGGWTVSRFLLPLGFLVTVPADIVTSPIQLLGAIIFLLTPFSPL